MSQATRLAALLASGVLAVAGCGGDSKTGKRGGAAIPSPVTQPTPRQSVAVELVPFNRAIGTHNCRAYQPLVHSFARGLRPGAPATTRECTHRDTAFEDLLGKRMDRASQYGTGGLMEGPGPGNARKYTVWVLDGDGRFRYVNVSGSGSAQVGTPFSNRPEAARVASRYLQAVRMRDCATLERLFSPRGSRLVVNLGSPRAACGAVLRGRFLAPALRATPDPRIEVLGGTRNLAFVGVATRRTYFTMTLGDARNQGLRVFDVLASSPVEFPKK